MGRMVRSMVLLSNSIRPSERNKINPPQYFAMYLSASPVGDLTETCALSYASQVLKSATIGVDLSFRTASL